LKKLLVVLISLIIALSSLTIVSAASLNQYEQEVYNILATKFFYQGKAYGFPIEYLNQAENYFLQIDITRAQRNEMMPYLEKAKAVMIKNKDLIVYKDDVIYIEEFLEKAKDALLLNAQKAGAVVGIKIIYDGENLVGTRTVNGQTTIVFIDTPIIKVTGLNIGNTPADATNTATVVVLILILLPFMLYRKRIKFGH